MRTRRLRISTIIRALAAVTAVAVLAAAVWVLVPAVARTTVGLERQSRPAPAAATLEPALAASLGCARPDRRLDAGTERAAADRRVTGGGEADRGDAPMPPVEAAEFDLMLPPGPGPHPAVLVLPILKGNHQIERYFARALVSRGFAVVIVLDALSVDWRIDVAGLGQSLRRIVERDCRILAWMMRHPRFEADRIGVLGISFGAMRATFLTALEPRLRGAALLLAGGDLPYIFANSSEGQFRRYREHQRQARHRDPPALAAEVARHFPLDPLVFAPAIGAERVFLVLARRDTVVPYQKGRELRERLGRPETMTLPTGHYDALLYAPLVSGEVAQFFSRRLTPP